MEKNTVIKPIHIERFYSRLIKSIEGCWLWIGNTDKDGYGIFHVRPHQKAHRFSYELFKGLIPKGLYVCHTCDNPSCVNPKHLWLGSPKDNVKDMFHKGRHYSHNGNKKICKRGHKFTKQNTYIAPKGNRACKICRRASLNKYKKTKNDYRCEIATQFKKVLTYE